MQPHVKVYCEFFEIGQDDYPLCTMCTSKKGTDVHHIHSRKMGSQKTFEINGKTYDINAIENLVLLCRSCHNDAHAHEITKDMLWLAQQYKIRAHGKY